MQPGDVRRRKGPLRPGLPAVEPEVADVAGCLGTTHIECLQDPGDAPPAGWRAVEIGDAGVAVPLHLVGLARTPRGLATGRLGGLRDGEQPRGCGGVGDVEQLVAHPPVGPEQIGRLRIGVGQRGAVAQLHVLGAARPRSGGGHVAEQHGRGGIGHVQHRQAVDLGAAGERVGGLAPVVADEQDPALAVAVRDRLVGRAALQVVQPDQAHVARRRDSRPVRRSRGGLHRWRGGGAPAGCRLRGGVAAGQYDAGGDRCGRGPHHGGPAAPASGWPSAPRSSR